MARIKGIDLPKNKRGVIALALTFTESDRHLLKIF